MTTNQIGIIIGLTGRLCCGKHEIAQIIKQHAKSPCQTVQLEDSFKVKQFFNELLHIMDTQGIQRALKGMSGVQLDNLKTIIRDIYNKYITKEVDVGKQMKLLHYNEKCQIVYPISYQNELDILFQRNYFHLIAIQTPTMKRYQNFQQKYEINIPLDLFCIVDDIISDPVSSCMDKAKVILTNQGDQKDLIIQFYDKYQDIFRPIRPNWNQYFMHLAHVVKVRSNCMKRAVGVVVVKDDRIVATGYNGTPNGKMNCWEGGCTRCNMNTKQGVDLEKCFCFHAEENALLEIGTARSKGMILYTTLFPCLQCTKLILASGFEKIYYEEDFDNGSKTSELYKFMKVEQVDTSHYVY